MAVEVVKARVAMTDHALISKQRPGQIFASHVGRTSDEVKAILPKKETVKCALRYTQRGKVPTDPKFLKDFTVEDDFNLTCGRKRFLLHDVGCEAVKRVLVFASDEGLRHLASQESWFMDGNFKMAPKIFSQLYVIPTKLGSSAVTCCYALLPDKTEESYKEMFRVLHENSANLGYPLDRLGVLLDFELPVVNAVKLVFGSHIKFNGCFYHVTLSTWRKVQELTLTALTSVVITRL